MNWKFKLSLALAVILTAVVFLKLSSSQAQSDKKASVQVQQNLPVVDGKVTHYPNGVSRIEPQAFAVSGKVRDMPEVDPDALVKNASFKDTETRLEERREKLREAKGITEQDDDKEINELNTKEAKKVIPGAGIGDRNFLDPLVKRKSLLNAPDAPQTMPTPSLTFDGATQADNRALGQCCSTPPDPNGDVGPNHYVNTVNTVLKIFNKNGTVAKGPVKLNSLFSALPAEDPCRTLNDGDPIVLYDSLADRWHISQFALPTIGNTSYQCVALSVTGDPTGAYYAWSYAYPIGNITNDYPKVGVWTDAYHMTFNQFTNDANEDFLGIGVLSQDRKKALAGDPTAAAIYVNIGDVDPGQFAALPGDIDGYVAPPTGLAEIIGTELSTTYGDPVDGLRIYKWVPNFDNPGSSALNILQDAALAPFDPRQPQPSGSPAPYLTDIEVMGAAPTQYVDSVAGRSMHRFAYRNFGTQQNPINSYTGNFTVNVSGVKPISAATYQSAIRWFEFRRVNDTVSVFDQGTHNLTPGDGVNGLNNWVGSVAQDNRGDIALGFSQAGTTQKADIKIAGRTNNVQNSGTLNEGEALLQAAGGVQQSLKDRWGDYSSMSIDPTDDCTFWYTNEYYATTSTADWSTRIGKFRFPQCVDAPKATITGTVTSCETGAPFNKASVDATGGFNRITNANGTYSIIVSPGTYTLNAGRSTGLFSSTQNTTVANGQTATVNICISSVTSQAPQFVSESCGAPNSFPDPGEQLTVSLPLQNPGSANTGNLTATLQATGGVINPGGAQNYGTIAPGSTVTKNFNFTVNPNLSCGSPVTLTFNVTDGTNNYGTVTKTYETGARTQTFSENFDSVTAPALPAGWTNVQIKGTGINWVTTTTAPNSPPNSAFANDSPTPNTSALVSPPIQIQIADAQLSFKNKYNTEFEFDGMVLEYSTDNGQNWLDILTGGGSFASGGYNFTISSRYDNSLGGRRGWTGNVGSSYIDTVVNLPASLNGQSVRFRWVMATDTDNPPAPAVTGVNIDDVKVFGARQSCNAPCSSTGPTGCRFQRRADFDGDAKSDVSVYRPDNGVWYLLNSGSGFSAVQFGLSTDKIVPADYDGDGKTDIAVWRDGTWFIQRSGSGFTSVQFGSPGDIPMPADFDGDGKAELVVYRPSSGVWYTLNLANNAFNAVQFGSAEDKPVIGDFDGDCKADYAVFRPSNGVWYMLRSSQGFTAVQFGISTDRPVVGDYDGDGKSDVAIFRPSESNWYILRSRDGFTAVQFGSAGDVPVPADYDGDGKTDVAVFRPNGGNWYQLRSSSGFAAVQFGASSDRPVPSAYVP